MQAYEMDDLIAEAGAGTRAYLEFLRVPDLSVGLYRLAAGAIDPQLPHTEDEVYYVVSGRGRIRVADEDRAVMPGSVVYVAKAGGAQVPLDHGRPDAAGVLCAGGVFAQPPARSSPDSTVSTPRLHAKIKCLRAFAVERRS